MAFSVRLTSGRCVATTRVLRGPVHAILNEEHFREWERKRHRALRNRIARLSASPVDTLSARDALRLHRAVSTFSDLIESSITAREKKLEAEWEAQKQRAIESDTKLLDYRAECVRMDTLSRALQPVLRNLHPWKVGEVVDLPHDASDWHANYVYRWDRLRITPWRVTRVIDHETAELARRTPGGRWGKHTAQITAHRYAEIAAARLSNGGPR